MADHFQTPQYLHRIHCWCGGPVVILGQQAFKGFLIPLGQRRIAAHHQDILIRPPGATCPVVRAGDDYRVIEDTELVMQRPGAAIVQILYRL